MVASRPPSCSQVLPRGNQQKQKTRKSIEKLKSGVKQDKLHKKGQAENNNDSGSDSAEGHKKVDCPAKFENGGCRHVFNHFQLNVASNIHPAQVKHRKQSSPG